MHVITQKLNLNYFQLLHAIHDFEYLTYTNSP